MARLLQGLKLIYAVLFNILSILFVPTAWIIKITGTFLTIGADAILDLLNSIGNEVYKEK